MEKMTVEGLSRGERKRGELREMHTQRERKRGGVVFIGEDN